VWTSSPLAGLRSHQGLQGGAHQRGVNVLGHRPADLYVVRNAHHELARVELAPDWSAGRVTQRITDTRLRYPTTAAVVPSGLMVVNGQLDRQQSPPAVLPFDVVTVALPR
jgi:superoxide dismutase, Cu-Zn family